MSAAASVQTQTAKPQAVSNSKHAGLLLQRKCACGSPTVSLAGECAQCKSKKRLQTKLAIGASNDPLEQEADRVADQVLASPANPAVSGAPPHIQRFTEQPSTPTVTAPASVNRVLASPGRPLGPTLRQDMEQRFGHDFSRVRVHVDGLAANSAAAVDARAYTVGSHVVFGSGQYSSTTDHGRRLLAHELTHVAQQGAASLQANNTVPVLLQRDPTPGAAAPKTEEQEGEGPLNVVIDHPGRGVELDGQIVVTYADAARWYTWRWLVLESMIGDMKREKMELPDGLADVSEAARVRGKALEKRGNADVSDDWIESMLSWLDRATDLYGQAQAAQGRVAAWRMQAALKGLRDNEEQLKKLEAALPEIQRAAFRAGDESKLLQIADAYYTIYNSLGTVKNTVVAIADEIDEMHFYASTNPWNGRYWLVQDLGIKVLPSTAKRVAAIANAADKFNKAYAVFQVVRGLLDVLGGGKTAVDEGAARVNLFATSISAGGTLLSASAPFTLYTNMYLGPAVANALKSIGRMADLTSIENRNWIEAGELSQVKWSAEPGGKPMFLYILRVMLASRANEYDPPGEVVEYFLQNRSDFNAGAKGPDDLPPFEMWKPPDVKKIGTWVFQHRDDVWAMLYGTTQFAKHRMRAPS